MGWSVGMKRSETKLIETNIRQSPALPGFFVFRSNALMTAGPEEVLDVRLMLLPERPVPVAPFVGCFIESVVEVGDALFVTLCDAPEINNATMAAMANHHLPKRRSGPCSCVGGVVVTPQVSAGGRPTMSGSEVPAISAFQLLPISHKLVGTTKRRVPGQGGQTKFSAPTGSGSPVLTQEGRWSLDTDGVFTWAQHAPAELVVRPRWRYGGLGPIVNPQPELARGPYRVHP